MTIKELIKAKPEKLPEEELHDFYHLLNQKSEEEIEEWNISIKDYQVAHTFVI